MRNKNLVLAARNFGASLGLAVLGAILIARNGSNLTVALTKHGVPGGVAHPIAASFGGSGPGADVPLTVGEPALP